MHWRFLLKIAIGGIALMLIVRPVVGAIIQRLAPWKNVIAPEGVPPEKWKDVLAGDPPAIKWLGGLECLLAYGAYLGFGQQAALVVGGWLAFKVASKWESWHNISQIPQSLEGVSQIDYLRARRQWASTLYSRFLVGTLLNIMSGFLAAAIVRALR